MTDSAVHFEWKDKFIYINYQRKIELILNYVSNLVDSIEHLLVLPYLTVLFDTKLQESEKLCSKDSARG